MTSGGADCVAFRGVPGCGKSTPASAVAASIALPWLGGDAPHCAASWHKMAEGQALNDAEHQSGLARLRGASPALRFVFLEIGKAEAVHRVAVCGKHFFSASLVGSKFEALTPRGACPHCKPRRARG